MIRNFILGNAAVKILAISLIVLLSGSLSFASEQIETTTVDDTIYIEIEVVEDLDYIGSESEFIYANSTTLDYESKSVDKRDILRAIPSIGTPENKAMGLVIPPFAYFKTKF